jgi:preprotein translocase subunit SecA
MAFSLQSFFDRGEVKGYQNKANKIGTFEERLSGLSDEQFPIETENLKTRHQQGESLDDLLPEAFALVREAAKRTMNKRHYDVQLIGGIVLHEGSIAEMRTGEGKTMVATLPVYLNALAGRGVHVVTVNDYLARRDATWMGQIYNFLGLSIGVINDQNNSFVYDPTHQELDAERDEEGSFKVVKQFLRPVSRKEAYAADITYGTNSQYGFDYLRDNLVNNKEEIVQRDHFYAVVDEVDSILIDESRTPLIISSPIAESESLYKTVRDVANKMEIEKDYTVDEKMKAITLTDDGITKAEKLLGISDMYTEKGIKYAHYLETAVRARALFTKDKDYVVKDGEVIIVDTFTGRMQPGRRWSEGLHQAIEAKEGVKVEQETRSVASITYQNYFKLYEKLAGMTGTAKTSEEEFMKVYGLGVISVPTNRPTQRIDHNDLIFQTENGKFQ